MRCPDCNKFVGLEFGEPEVAEIFVSDDGCQVMVVVNLERNCAECGQTLKTASLDLEADTSEAVKKHEEENPGGKHEYDAQGASIEVIEEGGGRYAKSYFGASVEIKLTCTECKNEDVDTITLSDKVAASEMEEAV